MHEKPTATERYNIDGIKVQNERPVLRCSYRWATDSPMTLRDRAYVVDTLRVRIVLA